MKYSEAQIKKTTDWLKKNGVTFEVCADGVYADSKITIPSGDIVLLPALVKCGNVYVRENGKFTAPALVKCGYVDVYENGKFTAPALAECGYVYVRENGKFTAPALVKCGYVDVYENGKFTAPALVKCGYVDVYENGKFTAPALVTIGHVAYKTEIFGYAVEVIDGIGTVTVSEKTRDGITIRSCKKAKFTDSKLTGEKMFVISQGEHNAHGETLSAAMSDLSYKTADRDVGKYKNMPMNTEKTPYEWAMVYRVVTGACQMGTESFMKGQGALKEKYALSEIIQLTRGAYGADKFASVVGAK